MKTTRTTVKRINQTRLGVRDMGENQEKLKRRRVNVDHDSDDLASSRVQKPLKLNVRDRLGMSTALHKTNSDGGLLSRTEKFGLVRGTSKPAAAVKRDITTVKVTKSSSSEDDHDPLAVVKVKTLEEIRLEKMKKMAAQEDQTSKYLCMPSLCCCIKCPVSYGSKWSIKPLLQFLSACVFDSCFRITLGSVGVFLCIQCIS